MTQTTPEFESVGMVLVPGIEAPVMPMDVKLRTAVPLFGGIGSSPIRALNERLETVLDEHRSDSSAQCGTALAYGNLVKNELIIADTVLRNALERQDDIHDIKPGRRNSHDRRFWTAENSQRRYEIGRISAAIVFGEYDELEQTDTHIREGWVWALHSSRYARPTS